MGVLIPNESITLYRYENKSYTRFNIPDVNVNYKRNCSVDSKGINIKYSVKIVLNAENNVIEGDKIIIGNIYQDIEKLSDLSDYKQIMTVVSIQKNYLLNTLIIECV